MNTEEVEKALAELRDREKDRNSILYFTEFNEIMDKWEKR